MSQFGGIWRDSKDIKGHMVADEPDPVNYEIIHTTASTPQKHRSALVLNPEQFETFQLLQKWNMGDLFHRLKDEQIHVRQLKVISDPLIVALFTRSPGVKLRRICEFQMKLNAWRRSIGIPTNDVAANRPSYNLNQDILKNSPVLSTLTQMNHLARDFLVDTVVRYFINKGIPFTQELRDDMADQITKKYPNENRFYYSDNGLEHNGEDKLFQAFLQLKHSNSQPMESVTEIIELEPQPPTMTPEKSLNISNARMRVKAKPDHPQPQSPPPSTPNAVAAAMRPATRVKVPLKEEFLRKVQKTQVRPVLMARPLQPLPPKRNRGRWVKQKRSESIEAKTMQHQQQVEEVVVEEEEENQQQDQFNKKTLEIKDEYEDDGDDDMETLSANETEDEAMDDEEEEGEVLDPENGNGAVHTEEEDVAERQSLTPFEGVYILKNRRPRTRTELKDKEFKEEGVECLGFVNRLKDGPTRKDFCLRFERLFANHPELGPLLGSLNYAKQPLDKRLAIALFLLPIVLSIDPFPNIDQRLVVTNFISLCPTVQALSQTGDDQKRPLIACIGSLRGKLSYAVQFRERLFRCSDISRAISIVVELTVKQDLAVPNEMANVWQFLMCHFYGMEKLMVSISANVKELCAELAN